MSIDLFINGIISVSKSKSTISPGFFIVLTFNNLSMIESTSNPSYSSFIFSSFFDSSFLVSFGFAFSYFYSFYDFSS